MSGPSPRPVDVLLGHLASVCVAALVICGLAVLGTAVVHHLAAM
jgi:hypothetical protein